MLRAAASFRQHGRGGLNARSRGGFQQSISCSWGGHARPT
jgi:hypothetical protein